MSAYTTALGEFKEILPYASVIFGVYQPLLGWKAKQTIRRVDRERRLLVERVFNSAFNSSLRNLNQGITSFSSSSMKETAKTLTTSRIPLWMRDSIIANDIESVVYAFVTKERRLPQNYTEWAKIINDVGINSKVESLRSELIKNNIYANSKNIGLVYDGLVTDVLLSHIIRNNGEAFNAILRGDESGWQTSLDFVDPLAKFDLSTQQSILSPIGLVNLFSQYFYELNTFLGSPVGHVWISPGGSVELFEITSKRTITERQVERLQEAITKTELSTMQQDEISDAIKDENNQNINLGITASGGTDLGVYHAEASADLGLQSTRSSSSEAAHKNTRQQSQRLSSELRRSLKTTFRTTVDIQDTSSRRHVLSNTTDKLINYEFRRKMRRVAVQVQHLGTYLCWQVYVDEAGKDLGISELVHVAKPEDLESSIQPPEAPPVLPSKEESITFDFPYQMTRNNGSRPESHYYQGLETEEDGSELYGRTMIVWEREYSATPPGHGYKLNNVSVTGYQGTGRGKNQPSAIPKIPLDTIKDNKFKLSLPYVTFGDSDGIRFVIKLIWTAPNQSDLQEQYKQKMAEYTEARRREAHAQYVDIVRERIKLASNIRRRPSEDLREEERIVVFRRLVRQLMGIKEENNNEQSPHVISELIRSIFDVDRMLYYVAPDWWMPRPVYQQQMAPSQNTRGETKAPQTFSQDIKKTMEDVSIATRKKEPEMMRMRSPSEGGYGNGKEDDRGRPIDNHDCPEGFVKDPFSGNCIEESNEKIEKGRGPPGPIGRPPLPPIGRGGGGRIEDDQQSTQGTPLTQGDTIGWGGVRSKDRNNYLITEDSEPAPLGASIGWLIQLDGDNHRNAFLNSPWVKAIIPIHPSKEAMAIEWLKKNRRN